MPKTRLGKWSFGLIITFFFLVAMGMSVVQVLGQRGGETIFDNLWISIPMLGAGAYAIAACITGAVSIWKQKERSVFVCLGTAVGLLVLIFVLGEIMSQH